MSEKTKGKNGVLSQKGVKGFIKTGRYKDLQWYIENDIEKYKEIEELYSETDESVNKIADKYNLQRTVFREKARKEGWKRRQVGNEKVQEDSEVEKIEKEESFEDYIRILDELSLEERKPIKKKESF